MSRVKEIKKIDGLDPDDEDGCTFTITHNEDMTEIGIILRANRAVTPENYFNTLCDFLNTVSENPASLFVENVDNEDKEGFH